MDKLSRPDSSISFPALPGSPAKPASVQFPSTPLALPASPDKQPRQPMSSNCMAPPSTNGHSRIFPSVKLSQVQRNSIASDDSIGSSNASVDATSNYAAVSRPVSGTTVATSRPTSIASNASASSQVQGQLTACADLLSPGLASALGLLPFHSPGAHLTSSSSKQPHRDSDRRRVRAQSTQGPGIVNRRPSMPIVPSMNHRMSVASISSFESLPEDETVHGFLASPLGRRPKSRAGSYERDNSLHRTASTSANGVGSSIYLPPVSIDIPSASSVPTSPTKLSRSPIDSASASGSSTGHGVHHDGSTSQTSTLSAGSGRPSAFLRRSATAPTRPTDTTLLMARRSRSAKELLETERSFVASLTLIDQEYYQPLMASLGRGRNSVTLSPPLGSSTTAILSRKSMGEIFSNFPDIFQLSKELLSRLEDRLGRGEVDTSGKAASPTAAPSSQMHTAQDAVDTSWNPASDSVGDILVTLAPFLKMYSLFVKNFSSALQRIESEQKTNEAFARFLKDTEKRRWAKEKSATGINGRQSFGFGLGFQAHLLTIVQRIPRYKLLVDDLIKCTPESHPDSNDLIRAGKMIEQVASYINENVRQHEMVLTILSLQKSLQGLTEPLVVPGRALIRRGTLMKTCRRNIQPREFFLFTDCLIYASPISGGIESASAAWFMLAQKGGLYGGASTEQVPTSPTSLHSPAGPASPIETILSPPSAPNTRLRTFSVPEPYTPLAGAIFSLAGHQLQFRAKFPLRDCTIVGVENSINEGLRHCFEIRTPEKSFAVYAESSSAKDAWVTSIREARADFMSARRTLKAEEDSIEAKRERRRSLYKLDAGKTNNRRLSTQSLGAYLSGISLSGQDNAITENEGENVGPDANAEERVVPAPPARSRVDSLPSLLRPPSFPSLASAGTNLSLAALLASSAGATPTKPLRVLEDYNAPVWVPDSRADKCCNCCEPFGMWRRKHHCRLCGQVVCWNCSQRSFLIPSYQDGEEDKPARACDRCYDSVFPPDSTEEAPDLFAFENASSEVPSSAEMTSVPSTDESVTTALSTYRLDSDAEAEGNGSHGSPVTPAGEDSPAPSRADSPFTDSPPSLAKTAASALAKKSAAAAMGHNLRPKSLRFEDLPPPQMSTEEAEATPLRLTSSQSLQSMPSLPARSKSLSAPSAAFPRMPLGMQHRASTSAALEAQLFTSHLSPQIQAATSGSGTFRLVTPRLTTPESELPPGASGARRGSHVPSIMEAGYFGMSEVESIPEDGPAVLANSDRSSPSSTATSPTKPSEPFKPSMLHGPNGIPAHLRPQKKRPMSAAARLSTFYGPLLSSERKK